MTAEDIPFLEEGRTASSVVFQGWSSLEFYRYRPDEMFLVGMLDFTITQSFGTNQTYSINLEKGRFQYVLYSSEYFGMIVEAPVGLGLAKDGVCYLYLQYNMTSKVWSLNHYYCYKDQP